MYNPLEHPPTLPLRPVIPNNACTPRITAAAGTKFAGASFRGTFSRARRRVLFPHDSGLHTEMLLPTRGVAASGFSPNVADHPLRPATDRRLGGPLPRQLANRTQAHPASMNLSSTPDVRGHVIRYYPRVGTAIPICGADCLRVTHPFAAILADRSTCMYKTRHQRSF